MHNSVLTFFPRAALDSAVIHGELHQEKISPLAMFISHDLGFSRHSEKCWKPPTKVDSIEEAGLSSFPQCSDCSRI